MSVQQRDCVRFQGQGWHLVEGGEAEAQRHLVKQSPVGPPWGPGPEQAVRPELCTRMGEVAQERCVSQSHRRRRGLQGAPWSLQFLGHLCSHHGLASGRGLQSGPLTLSVTLGRVAQPL